LEAEERREEFLKPFIKALTGAFIGLHHRKL